MDGILLSLTGSIFFRETDCVAILITGGHLRWMGWHLQCVSLYPWVSFFLLAMHVLLTCNVKIIVFWLSHSCPTISPTYREMEDPKDPYHSSFTRMFVIALPNNWRHVRLKPRHLISFVRKRVFDVMALGFVRWIKHGIIPQRHYSSCKYCFLVSCFPAGVSPEWPHPFPSKPHNMPSLLCLFRSVVCGSGSCSVLSQMKKIPNIMTG